mgnify:CR=1 FL=1
MVHNISFSGPRITTVSWSDWVKIYGYAKGDSSETLLELDEVSICLEDAEAASKFADFAKACADEMAALGDDYDHVHFAGGETPDIIIARLPDVNI